MCLILIVMLVCKACAWDDELLSVPTPVLRDSICPDRLYTFTPATISLPHAMDRALAKLKGGRDTFIVKPDASSQVSAECYVAT